MKTINFRTTTLSLFLLSLLSINTTRTFASEKVIDRISKRIAIINDGYFRVVAINTDEGIVVIDAHVSVEDMEACKELIEQEFKTDEFKYVVYSHGDLEHVLGYPVFKKSLHVAHLGLRIRNERNAKYLAYIDSILPEKEAELALLDSSTENFSKALDEINKLKWNRQANLSALQLKPDIEFSDRMTLKFDSLTIELIYYGMGHGYSLFVSVPEEQFLYSSTASNTLPSPFYFIKYNTAFVDIDRSLGILKQFTEQNDTLKHIVPCHGPYLTNQQLKDLYDYHRLMYYRMQEAVAKNKTMDQIKEEFALKNLFEGYAFAREPDEKALERHDMNIEIMWDYIKNAGNEFSIP